MHKYNAVVDRLVKKLLPNIDEKKANTAMHLYKKIKIQQASRILAASSKLSFYHLDTLYTLCMFDPGLPTLTNSTYKLDDKKRNLLDYLYDVFNISQKIRKETSNRVGQGADSDQLFEVLAAWLMNKQATASHFYKLIDLIPKIGGDFFENDETIL